MNLKEQIENYIPFNEQEEKDKEYFIKFMNTFDNVLTRENEFGHFCSSAFVVNSDRTKVLLVYHNILNTWIYLGGHADGEEDLLLVAIREVEEETGVKTKPVINEIFAINSNPNSGHYKKGKFIPVHTHFDVVYLLEADDKVPLKIKEDENSNVIWMPIEKCSEEARVDFIKPIFEKLTKKVKELSL